MVERLRRALAFAGMVGTMEFDTGLLEDQDREEVDAVLEALTVALKSSSRDCLEIRIGSQSRAPKGGNRG
jgi:hypothetical protein